jgi:hypothetical protein
MPSKSKFEWPSVTEEFFERLFLRALDELQEKRRARQGRMIPKSPWSQAIIASCDLRDSLPRIWSCCLDERDQKIAALEHRLDRHKEHLATLDKKLKRSERE